MSFGDRRPRRILERKMYKFVCTRRPNQMFSRSKCLPILAALLLVVTVYNWASKISDNDSNGRVQFKESVKIIHRLFDEAIASITDAQMLVLLNTGYISHSQRRVYIVEPDINTHYDHRQWVVVFVQSRHSNSYQRELIRTTWANGSYYVNDESPYVFFVSGLETRCHCVTAEMRKEILLRQDLLLLNMDDTYDRLTIKGLLAMTWIEHRFGSSVRFIIKTDDDVILNTFRWMSILKGPMFFERTRFILGYVWQRSAVKRTGRYAVSVREYSLNYYPSFCSGSGYAMSRDAVATMLAMTSKVRFLKRDDPYITGLLAAEGQVSRYTFNIKTYVLYPANFKAVRSWERTMLVHGANDSTWHQVWDLYVLGSYSTSNSTPETSITFVTSEMFPEK
ncbi:hypothetical protein LSH36_845g00002 [Paralvinella palmiformis]|uniref:Hexosyltransferase n=1 Tax=Paralvinella palmiformis TaxID=53620 RepID=A0AAD9IYU1_9ANNE|nr:hypothetical protein LSH36_845g00002 [Paralvinella palmiformis]